MAGARLLALPSGALWWADQALLVVSDLHLGKADRIARRGGAMLPPYETRDTLIRLDRAISETAARNIVCLGDSFDDMAASDSLDEADALTLARLQAGRRWVWIEGNHDPGPMTLAGSHMGELAVPPLTFRHIAEPGAHGEVSGHYHPKAHVSMRGRSLTRPCFLIDSDRLLMPAFGTYTGGLSTRTPVLSDLMHGEARALLLGEKLTEIPMPR